MEVQRKDNFDSRKDVSLQEYWKTGMVIKNLTTQGKRCRAKGQRKYFY